VLPHNHTHPSTKPRPGAQTHTCPQPRRHINTITTAHTCTHAHACVDTHPLRGRHGHGGLLHGVLRRHRADDGRLPAHVCLDGQVCAQARNLGVMQCCILHVDCGLVHRLQYRRQGAQGRGKVLKNFRHILAEAGKHPHTQASQAARAPTDPPTPAKAMIAACQGQASAQQVRAILDVSPMQPHAFLSLGWQFWAQCVSVPRAAPLSSVSFSASQAGSIFQHRARLRLQQEHCLLPGKRRYHLTSTPSRSCSATNSMHVREQYPKEA